MTPAPNETAALVDETEDGGGTFGGETSAAVPRKDIAGLARFATVTNGESAI